jgi:hypothetical protein
MVIDVSLSLYFDEDVDDDDVRFCGDLSFLNTTLSLSLQPPLQQPLLLLLLSLFFFLVKVVKKRLRTQPLPR